MRTLSDELITIVREADPLDPAEVRSWVESEHRRRLLPDICGPLDAVAHKRRLRRSHVAAIAAAGVLVGGAAAAATAVLGGPAPDPVRAHLAELDQGMPPDLRYNPDLSNAHAVAATASGTLYAVDLDGGGYCLEAATAGDRPRGGSCITAADLAARPVEALAPIPGSDNAPLLIGGRLNSADLTGLEVSYDGGAPTPVVLGIDRYFLIEVPAADRAAALDGGARLTALDAAGQVAARVQIPPLRDSDPHGTALDDRQPIFVSTVSDGSDFTVVLAVEGRVNVSGYAGLELSYPDGTVVSVPTEADGRYRLVLPVDRRDDFARAFGVLTARDSAGRVLATSPVGSVAAWRARNG
jgi:hypothetical protein